MTKPKRVVTHPNICAHAKALGVSREHLYRVLTGQRDSRELMLRYQAILAGDIPDPQTYKPKAKVLIEAMERIAKDWPRMTKGDIGTVASEALVECGAWEKVHDASED